MDDRGFRGLIHTKLCTFTPSKNKNKTGVRLRGLKIIVIHVQPYRCAFRPHDHKLRKFLSLNLSNFTGHTVLINCRCEPNVLLNKSLKFRFINKTTAKIIVV